ncbi:hypothetical protein [Catellatospora bangladeshensis]|uniref:XRE family transcriptional regulator n=1 Tax=Catellatospora bangladeshensis TaxID=310355 RepID=A0A8J3JNF3_9ACTN|nr:hypothetical protein [Catellatospora bangladeshensis]GIF81933.1 hypothetical protein Cba03nite_32820 [Catellatospora bangladeshensis]
MLPEPTSASADQDVVRQPRPADRELRRLLRDGTFAQVLDHAFTTRGLSLERVQHHLTRRGVQVSRAALSYWRHGRSRPERSESLRAVTALEELLELPPASLVSMLGPPRPRGRRPAEPGTVDRRRLWPAHAPLLAALDAPPDGQLRHLDVHERVRLDERRRLVSITSRLVLEATTDRVDRCMVYHWGEGTPPELRNLRYCRQGRVRADAEGGATVFELRLDQRLAALERTVVEFEYGFADWPDELTWYHHRFTRPARQYVLQVEFAGGPPATCVPFRQATLQTPRQLGAPLWIGESHTAHLVLTDVPPGLVGLRWEWD